MKMKKKTVIVLSSILVGILSLTAFGYFRFFGPILVNLSSESVERIGFIHPEAGEEWETTYIDPIEKEPLLEELREIKYRKSLPGCRCMGEAFLFIEYFDESYVKFDGYYLEKVSSGGDTTSYPTQRFDAVIAQLYHEYILD